MTGIHVFSLLASATAAPAAPAADLSGFLVGFPRRAGPSGLLRWPVDVAGVDVAGVDIGVAVDRDVVVATTPVGAVVASIPRRADRGAPDQAGGERGARWV